MKRGGGNYFSSKNAADHETVDGVDVYDQDDGGPNEFKSYEKNLRDHALFWNEKPFVETTYYPDVLEERTLSIPIPDYFSYKNATDHETVERGRRYQESKVEYKGDYEDHDVDTRDSSYGKRPSSEEEERDARDTMSGHRTSDLIRRIKEDSILVNTPPPVDLKRKYPKYTKDVNKLPTVKENIDGGRKRSRRKRRRTKRLFHKRYVERGKR